MDKVKRYSKSRYTEVVTPMIYFEILKCYASLNTNSFSRHNFLEFSK